MIPCESREMIDSIKLSIILQLPLSVVYGLQSQTSMCSLRQMTGVIVVCQEEKYFSRGTIAVFKLIYQMEEMWGICIVYSLTGNINVMF